MNYLVKNANHGYDLVNISISGTVAMLRLFRLYTGTTDGRPTIPRDGLETNITEYQGMSILTDTDGKVYMLNWYRKIEFTENQLQVGGTYAVVTNDTFNYVIRLDAEKYPDLEISDWKYIRSRSLRPIVKFTVCDSNLLNCEKIYYLNSNVGSTKFITPDIIDASEVYEDKDVQLVPDCVVVFNGNTATISVDPAVNGCLRFVDKSNMRIDDYAQLTNGSCTIPCEAVDASKPATCTVLYGFNKIGTITK